MTSSLHKLCIIFSFIAVSFCLPSFVFADEMWHIDKFNSDLTVQQDGKVAITDTIEVDFGLISKHGIFRELPYAYEDENGNKTYIELVVKSVQIDNSSTPYEVDKNSANLRIKIGDPDKTITGKHTYKVNYDATGVLRSFGAYDELYWNVTGFEWPVEIRHVSAKVTLPQSGVTQYACYWGSYGSTESCSSTKVDDRTVNFESTRSVANGSGITIATGYTAGMVPILTVAAPPTPFQQIQWVPLLGAFGITLIGGLYFIWKRWWQHGRDYWHGHHAVPDGQARHIPFGIRESIAPEFSVPQNLRPAELGTLLDERADTLDVTATIVDLAVRGYVTIGEEKKKWAFGSKDYVLKQTKGSSPDLLRYEHLLLDSLFAAGKEVRLSELKNTFYDELAQVKQALYAEVVKKDLFTKDPEQVRSNYYGAGIGLLVFGGAIGGITLSTASLSELWFWLVLGFSGGLIVTSVAILATAHTMPARTANGRQLYRQALGYKLFVGQVEKYRAQFMEKENMFEAVLPYAIVFGVTAELARAMKLLELKPSQMGWYHGVHPFSPTAFARDMNTFSHTISTAMASTPSSSGSGGGGFSGGGFGGGGGGSW